MSNFSGPPILGLQAYPSIVKIWLAAPCIHHSTHSHPRPKGNFFTSILKEKKPFPADFSLWLGPEMFPELMSTPVTSKENEITKIVSDPAFPEASINAKKKFYRIRRSISTSGLCYTACKLRMVFTFFLMIIF